MKLLILILLKTALFEANSTQITMSKNEYIIFDDRYPLQNTSFNNTVTFAKNFYEAKPLRCLGRCNQEETCNLVFYNSTLTQQKSTNCIIYSIVGLQVSSLLKYLLTSNGNSVYIKDIPTVATTTTTTTTKTTTTTTTSTKTTTTTSTTISITTPPIVSNLVSCNNDGDCTGTLKCRDTPGFSNKKCLCDPAQKYGLFKLYYLIVYLNDVLKPFKDTYQAVHVHNVELNLLVLLGKLVGTNAFNRLKPQRLIIICH